jgi:predicted DNA binding CopG/RHH family protein
MLPTRIIEKLRKEAGEWDAAIQAESPQKVQAMMDQAEPFVASRPVRLPVSLRMDPFDIAMLKRAARRKGIPYTQLMAMWLHERIEHEKTAGGC